VPFVVDHRVDRVDVAQHAHDLKLFLVQRVSFQLALHCTWVLDESRAVERADRFGVGDPRSDDLTAPGIARHEVRFDKPRRNAQVRLDEPSVEFDGRAERRRLPEVHVRRVV